MTKKLFTKNRLIACLRLTSHARVNCFVAFFCFVSCSWKRINFPKRFQDHNLDQFSDTWDALCTTLNLTHELTISAIWQWIFQESGNFHRDRPPHVLRTMGCRSLDLNYLFRSHREVQLISVKVCNFFQNSRNQKVVSQNHRIETKLFRISKKSFTLQRKMKKKSVAQQTRTNF